MLISRAAHVSAEANSRHTCTTLGSSCLPGRLTSRLQIGGRIPDGVLCAAAALQELRGILLTEDVHIQALVHHQLCCPAGRKWRSPKVNRHHTSPGRVHDMGLQRQSPWPGPQWTLAGSGYVRLPCVCCHLCLKASAQIQPQRLQSPTAAGYHSCLLSRCSPGYSQRLPIPHLQLARSHKP